MGPFVERVGARVERPLFLYDGDCGFCRYWIGRIRRAAGPGVSFQPFQDPAVAQRFPEVPRDQFAGAAHLVEPDGSVFHGAHAVFRAVAHGGRRLPLWLYTHVPGVAGLSEAGYGLVAHHRPLFSRLTAALWGHRAAPSTYADAAWLFRRLLGVAYLAAFWSLAVQIRGLVGHDGILPADAFLRSASQYFDQQQIGIDRYRLLPTVLWLGAGDRALVLCCVAGVVLALMLVAGILPLAATPLLWLDYLSLSIVGRDFLLYQWDALLLEAGALAILIAPATLFDTWRSRRNPPALARWLLWWLLFRLMLGSGIVKLTSGDPSWRALTALSYHYETQPIPTPLAWYAHRLPLWLHKLSTAGVFAIELGAPWLILAPRRPRHAACALLVGLQLLIALTGNYAFFNLLAIALSLPLLDDGAISRGRASLYRGTDATPVDRTRRAAILESGRKWITVAAAVLIVPLSFVMLASQMRVDVPGAGLVAPAAALVNPFESVNSYGLFAVMTTTRPEIIVEGSEDGVEWRAYEFKYKPGDLRRRPPWVAPHQPRLDWQMWFAALGDFEHERWYQQFCVRLLQGSPDVLKLLAVNPFPGQPPRYVRGVLYRYRFTDREMRGREGTWWTRERLGPYSSPLALRP